MNRSTHTFVYSLQVLNLFLLLVSRKKYLIVFSKITELEAKFLNFFHSKSQNYSEVSNYRDYLLNVIFASISKGIEKRTISMK